MAVLAVLLFLSPMIINKAQAADEQPQKIGQLLNLLNDPEVKAWIAAQPPLTQESGPVPAQNDFGLWESGVRTHLRDIRQAAPKIGAEFSGAAGTIATEVNGRGPGAILVLFLAFTLLGTGAELVFRRQINRRGKGGTTVAGGVAVAMQPATEFFAAIAPVIVFGAISLGGFLAFTWPPLLARLVLPLLLALIAWRIVATVTEFLLRAGGRSSDSDMLPDAGLLPVDTAAAVFWYRRIVAFAGVICAGWAIAAMMRALNFTPEVSTLIVYLLGLGLLAIAVETVWDRPDASTSPGHVRQWMLTFYLCHLWLFWVAGMNIALWVGVYAILLPPVLRATGLAVRSAFSASPFSSQTGTVRAVLFERGARAVVIMLAVIWLAMVVRLHPTALTQDAGAGRIIRGVLGGILLLLLADLVWQVLKGTINRRIELARIAGGDAADAARSGRLLTLLPILRNFLAALLGVVTIMMVLSGLGVEIGPLIAGAGIFGVAIGFGSQTLVKDVISGVFYMMDDAFRVGEYIQSGSYKGTVESFSIRSVKLRHHRGPIFTVPFGSLGAVQNMSRDWVIDKFLISVSYDADLAQVKKIVKGVGATLLEDPEFGPHIIETVKMKGVEAFGDYGINLSFAMMTKPGHQSTIRRRAYAMIRDAFASNGIEFASPTVQVAGDDQSAHAAVAATNDAMARKKAALAAKGEEDQQ